MDVLERPQAKSSDPPLTSPLGMLAELTHRCPLGCPYCSNPLALDGRADELAGYRGGYARKRAIAAEVVRLGLPLTINAVMHRANIDRVDEMVEFALALNASRVEIAHVQYYGWALKNRAALMPTPEQVA